jgi:hypothetical protein
LALLCYVYHEHWLEVGGDSVRLAVLETVPYALLVILGNVGLQVNTGFNLRVMMYVLEWVQF